MQQKQYKRLDIIWLPRNPQRIRINIDGTVKRNPSLGDCGRVIRNNQGGWLGEFVCNLGICSSPGVEMWGAMMVLKLTWKLGLKKIILELDSKLPMDTLMNKKTKTYWCSSGIYWSLSGKFWYVIDIERQIMANYNLKHELGLKCFNHPPNGLLVLWVDASGFSTHRTIPI